MSNESLSDATPDETARRLLSALTDGEADAAACAQASAMWAASGTASLRGEVGAPAAPGLRATWHCYQLIGDVLRSEDLAHPPDHDEAFLQRLRVRLAGEPAVLAPTPAAAAAPSPAPRSSVVPSSSGIRAPRRWALPAALAAGVMGLSTVLVSTQWRTPPAGAPIAAATQAGAGPVLAQPVQALPAPTQTLAAGGQLVRDAKLDRYLRAHREYGSAAPVSLPGGASRNIDTVSFQP